MITAQFLNRIKQELKQQILHFDAATSATFQPFSSSKGRPSQLTAKLDTQTSDFTVEFSV
jgi:hypothetical protein